MVLRVGNSDGCETLKAAALNIWKLLETFLLCIILLECLFTLCDEDPEVHFLCIIRAAFPVYNQSCTQFKLWMLASCPVTDLWCYSHLQRAGRSVFDHCVGPYKIKSTFCQIFRLDSTTTTLNELLLLWLLTWSTGWFGTYLGLIYDPFSVQ